MRLPFAPSVIRVKLFYTNQVRSNAILNTLHFRYTGAAGTNAEMATLAANIAGYWGATLKSDTNTTVSLTTVETRDLSSDMGTLGTWTGTTAGSRSDTINSAQAALLVTYTIPRTYRGGKPKTFLPVGDAIALLDEGHWTSDFVSSVQGNLETFLADILADTSAVTFSDQVNVSYYEPPNVAILNPVTGRYRTVSTLRTVAQIDTITTVTCQPQIASQRRRTGRRR